MCLATTRQATYFVYIQRDTRQSFLATNFGQKLPKLLVFYHPGSKLGPSDFWRSLNWATILGEEDWDKAPFFNRSSQVRFTAWGLLTCRSEQSEGRQILLWMLYKWWAVNEERITCNAATQDQTGSFRIYVNWAIRCRYLMVRASASSRVQISARGLITVQSARRQIALYK